MSKPIKKVTICLVILVTILLFVLWSGRGARRYFDGLAYRYRFRECALEDLRHDLEKVFAISFPKKIKEIKAAKTPGSWDSNHIHFLIMFRAEPNTVAKLLQSFPEGVQLDAYTSEFDGRSTFGPPEYIPDWYTQPILQGKMGRYPLADAAIEIYLDTTDEKNVVVYIEGLYSPENVRLRR